MNPVIYNQGQKLSSQASYKKSNGILTLSFRDKNLFWNSQADNTSLTIPLEQIIEVKKAAKETSQTELLFLKAVNYEKGIVFSFSGDRKIDIRDRFYDLLTRKDDFDKVFKSLSVIDKKRILQILLDPQLSYLFEELVMSYKIISKEDFYSYVRKRYPAKITFVNTQQVIQLARSDEIQLFSGPYRNILDHSTKRKILHSYDSINVLYEFEIKTKKSEQNFWREFLNNQKKNNTELVGGFKPIFFTHDEERIIKIEKDKNKSHQHINYTVQPSSGRTKISKRNEIIELHKNYSHKYFGNCLNVAEYDYKDREMKKISAAISEEEEFNKKEMANFIENINNYSMRKLENINYITHNNFVMRLSKNKSSQQNTSINVAISQPVPKNPLEKSEIFIEKNLTCNTNDIHIREPKEKIKTLNLLQEMKNKRQLNKISQSSIETFKNLNHLVKQNSTSNWKPMLMEKEKIPIEIMKWKLNLLRDLIYINNNLRNSTYSEDIKRGKKNNIKKLTAQTEDKMQKIENDESTTPVMKTNFQVYKSSLNKLKI